MGVIELLDLLYDGDFRDWILRRQNSRELVGMIFHCCIRTS